MSDRVTVRTALISVSDKTDLIPFARRLVGLGVRLISTGGTARALKEAGIASDPVESVTGFPEMMGGRVKTLHPKIHGGLLAVRDDAEHVAAMAEHGIVAIDLVCVNLYPFEKTVAGGGRGDEAIEQIDIGGPSMIRSAAKNHRDVAVVTSSDQYDEVSSELESMEGATSMALRSRLAGAAFARTAGYDTAIAAWMGGQQSGGGSFPDPLVMRYERLSELRYGENPHQAAALYGAVGGGAVGGAGSGAGRGAGGVARAKQLHGKGLSYNNLMDADAALALVCEFEQAAAAVIKHTNPCGCAIGADAAEAFEKAYSGDPLAAFGGILALNRAVSAGCASAITAPGLGGQKKFLEVILAPSFEEEALVLLREHWKNVRLMAVGELAGAGVGSSVGVGVGSSTRVDLRSIVGGVLAQESDMADMSSAGWKYAAGPELKDPTRATLELAWCAVKHAKSNAIVIANDGAVVGVGAGQMDRVESCKIAIAKANARGQRRSEGAVAASDAFFPFRDGPDALIAAGVGAIVQPGGSVRDDQTIEACREASVTLMFTGRRHFRH